MQRTRKSLHPTQDRLLEILKNNIDDPLTVRELQDILSVSSTSVIHHHLTQLERKGYLRRNPSNPKDYQILGDSPDKKVAFLNLYGLAECGPSGSLLDGDPIDRIKISAHILGFPSQDAFMVKARGDSMTPYIKNGDLVIAKKNNDANSLIGKVAVCVNDGEALIKKIAFQYKQFFLVSLNNKFDPFPVADNFHVEGEVRSVISRAF